MTTNSLRSPLKGLDNYVTCPTKKDHHCSARQQNGSALSQHHHWTFLRATKKPRMNDNGIQHTSNSSKGRVDPPPNPPSLCPMSVNRKTVVGMMTNRCLPTEIPVKSWLVLPQSRYGIHYEMGSTTTSANSEPMANGISMLEMVANKSPFEMRMQQLRFLLQSKYPEGAALVYVREIFEPGDMDYLWSSSFARPPRVDVTTLTKQQVDRLHLMVIDNKRREMLTSFLRFYELQPFHTRLTLVVDHFAQFKHKYSKIRDCKVKFNRLFCFTFAINRFDGWMNSMERGFSRQKMVEGVALRWKNLLNCRTPEELGIDEEFSYPAVLTMLKIFKRKVESAPTFGDPPMVFKYE